MYKMDYDKCDYSSSSLGFTIVILEIAGAVNKGYFVNF